MSNTAIKSDCSGWLGLLHAAFALLVGLLSSWPSRSPAKAVQKANYDTIQLLNCPRKSTVRVVAKSEAHGEAMQKTILHAYPLRVFLCRKDQTRQNVRPNIECCKCFA
jgi:hypothetical protein